MIIAGFLLNKISKRDKINLYYVMLSTILSTFFKNLNLIFAFLVVLLLVLQLKEKITKTKKRQLLHFLKIFIIAVLGLNILVSFSQTIYTYLIWKNDPVSKYLLPPHTSFVYFFGYSFLHYFAALLVNTIFAFLVFLSIQKFNKKFEEVFFYEEEPYLAGFGILTVGWPNCLIYLILILSLGVILHLFHYLRGGLTYLLSRSHRSSDELGSHQEQSYQDEIQRLRAAEAGKPRFCETNKPIRLSLLYFWLPCALLVLILNDIISKWPVIKYFKITS